MRPCAPSRVTPLPRAAGRAVAAPAGTLTLGGTGAADAHAPGQDSGDLAPGSGDSADLRGVISRAGRGQPLLSGLGDPMAPSSGPGFEGRVTIPGSAIFRAGPGQRPEAGEEAAPVVTSGPHGAPWSRSAAPDSPVRAGSRSSEHSQATPASAGKLLGAHPRAHPRSAEWGAAGGAQQALLRVLMPVAQR